MASLEYTFNDQVRTLELRYDREYSIGRDADCAICFDGIDKISRRHCVVYFDSTRSVYALADLRSTNGTLLNGYPVGNKETALHDGDEIRIGMISVFFHDPDNRERRSAAASTSRLKVFSSMPLNGHADGNSTSPAWFKAGDKVGPGIIVEMLFQNTHYVSFLMNVRGEQKELRIIKDIPADYSAGKELAKIAEKMPEIKGVQRIELCGTLDNGLCYYVMSYSGAPTFSQLISITAPRPLMQCLPLIYSVGEVLQTANRHHLFHGDLHPDKICYSPRQSNQIIGIGFTEWKRKFYPEIDKIPGRWYSSPEFFKGTPLDWRADQYSLGIIFFQMLTGVLPFRSDSAKELKQMHLHATLPLPKERNPQIMVPAPVTAMLARLTMKDPAERYASWADFLNDLSKFNSQANQQNKASAT